MKKSFKRNYKAYLFCLLSSITVLIVVALSCKKQSNPPSSGSNVHSSSVQQESALAAAGTSTMTRQQSLARINALFKDELSTISASQVQGINKQQFIQWLRNSSIAGAEQKYLGPLLSSDVSEFILIKNVTVLATGKLATVAMVSVPTQLYSRYTKLIVLKDCPWVIGRLCFWFHCDHLDPTMCLCLSTMASVPLNSACPADECDPLGPPCRTPSGEPCGDPHFDQVIAAW
jgi:hypothetical protein